MAGWDVVFCPAELAEVVPSEKLAASRETLLRLGSGAWSGRRWEPTLAKELIPRTEAAITSAFDSDTLNQQSTTLLHSLTAPITSRDVTPAVRRAPTPPELQQTSAISRLEPTTP